jgi:hypothetical protein
MGTELILKAMIAILAHRRDRDQRLESHQTIRPKLDEAGKQAQEIREFDS